MATVASLRGPAHQTICAKCGDSPIAPDWVEYFTEERLILNFWSCTSCGHRFETEAALPAAPETAAEGGAVEGWPPSLVA